VALLRPGTHAQLTSKSGDLKGMKGHRMEVGHYLRMIRRRLWVFAIPVVAAIAAFLILGQGAQQWTSKVEVAVPTLAQNTSAGSVAVYVANFEEYLTTDPVLDQVARENPQVPRSSVKGGLSASQVGVSDRFR
jgi:hypothetical protein